MGEYMGTLAQLVSFSLGQHILETLSPLHSAIMSKLLLLAVALAVVLVTEVYSIPDCRQIGMEPTWHQFPSGKQCTCVTNDECDPMDWFQSFCWTPTNNRRSCSTDFSCGCVDGEGFQW